MAERTDNRVYWGAAPLVDEHQPVVGGFVERNGEYCYRIAHYQRMRPFFMTVISGFDHWMFVSSNGGLTCGRRDPDNALFPYTTDDKIHDADGMTGPLTAMRVQRAGRRLLWKPFTRDVPVYRTERNLYKNRLGNRLIFEEINHDLELAFAYSWCAGDRFGFVRQASLRSFGNDPVRVELLDGLRNVLPCGVNRALQTSMSTLVDAYKEAESHPERGAALYSLSSIPSDRAEPSESLAANIVWTTGLPSPTLLLSENQVAAFCAGAEVRAESRTRGQRGAFFVHSELTIAPGAVSEWCFVADVEQSAPDVTALFETIGQDGIANLLQEDLAAGRARLERLAGGADGVQRSSDRLLTARHYSNTLFNIMRGGTFHDAYRLPLADFLGFVEQWNRPSREKLAPLLGDSETIERQDLLAAVRSVDDRDAERLALEYLPLVFSRRHGDPSRPWNNFSIDIRNLDGSDRLHFEGNWRDIFQNWEALAISYPEYIESFVAKFVNASTVDGHNPYHISRDGIDWEELDPDDPWSNIGYWGDHQVNYLSALLDLSCRYHPGKINEMFNRDIFVFGDVPYRLKGYAELLRDPRNSVEFDPERARRIEARVSRTGSDGKLVTGRDGSIHRVNLLEKLLLPALVKLGGYVPGGGIWMNTQRPEWNDANNALAGYGLSMVTLCYLRRYLAVLGDLLHRDEREAYPISRELSDFFAALGTEFGQDATTAASAALHDDRLRKGVMDRLGRASETYREAAYRGFSGLRTKLERAELLEFIGRAVAQLDHSIECNRRPDGLFHSYNLLGLGEDAHAVERLAPMLEGQVAVLNSGALAPAECLAVLDALRHSELYRQDQDSYLLYPNRELPRFLEKNCIPDEAVQQDAWLCSELESGSSRYVERGVDGCAHFRRQFRNISELRAVLKADPAVTAALASRLCALYEAVFRHRHFTGRSGSMYKYEGLGCIYWHMVSKLALAVSDLISAAGTDADRCGENERLVQHYNCIREGLGMHKSPDHYGAFPVDPYSHTPAFAGVQQPGMTGQAKEDFITRFRELGVQVDAGVVAFSPRLLKRAEFLEQPAAWSYFAGGEERREMLEPGSLGFTLCGIPVVYRLAESASVRVHGRDGRESLAGNSLGQRWSRFLFLRDARLQKIVVDVPLNDLG